MKKLNRFFIVSFILINVVMMLSCSQGSSNEVEKLKVGVILNSGSADDKSFNEYTLKGARETAEETGLDFLYFAAPSTDSYDQSIESIITQGADLVITVGFLMGDSTAKAAQKHPDIKFAIVDNAYFPGLGCADTVKDCYTPEGGLNNVTSLMFAEDQAGYLAGVLAACMSKSETIATVSGMEIPPVVKYVVGFQTGAKSVKPTINLLNQYIPDFNDPATGEVVAQEFIRQGADVIFSVGGNTGNGGLLAAKQANIMAIGVDVDQYLTYPEVQSALISSAAKNMDVAVAAAVQDFAANNLKSGIRTATIASDGVGLAPYHDWEDKIPQDCKDKVATAQKAIKNDPTITGYTD